MQDAGAIAAKMGAGSRTAPLALACAEFGIDNDLELAHFLAQLTTESAGWTRFVESLNYSVEALIGTFSRSRISADDCARYGRTAGRAANQVMIANLVYGGEWGRVNLGNTLVGDGWKFRGHGPAQTTGRANVTRVSAALFNDLRLCDDPDPLASNPTIGARAAGYFWKSHGCDRFAMRDDVIACTHAWNGGKNGIDDRIHNLKRAKQFLGMPA